MPYISTEALLGAALLIVFAIGYQYLPKSGMPGSKATKKKNKKKAKPGPTEETVTESTSKGSTKGNRKDIPPVRKGEGHTAGTIPARNGVPVSGGAVQAVPSFAAVAGGSQPTKPKTLAEKLAPKQRKTKVDDMLAPEDRAPTHARVMKVTPAPSSSPPSLTPAPVPAPSAIASPVEAKIPKYEADYIMSSEDETSGTGTAAEIEEDDGWDVVPSKKNKALSISLQTSTPQTGSGSVPLPVSTKIQRKNARKAEAKKAEKAADEADRQKRLAMHKRDIEKERINEIYNQKKSMPAEASAGARATLDVMGS